MKWELILVISLAWVIVGLLCVNMVQLWFSKKTKRAYVIKQDETGQLFINESKVNEADVIALIEKGKICIYRGQELKIWQDVNGVKTLNRSEIDANIKKLVKNGINQDNDKSEIKEESFFKGKMRYGNDVDVSDGTYYQVVKF